MTDEAQSLHAAQSHYDNLAMEDFYGPDEAGDEMPDNVVACAWCKRMLFPGGIWFGPGLSFMRLVQEKCKITHGICPECDAMMRKGVKL